MTGVIEKIISREVFDSRGFPTVEMEVLLNTGHRGRSCVPSGASTGSFEAVEKRDGDKKRFFGKGVQDVLKNAQQDCIPALIGLSPFDQQAIDSLLCQLDGTENKNRFGANVILALSQAIAYAAANALTLPLAHYLGGINMKQHKPKPMFNVINGGVHADNALDIQEFMIVPLQFDTFKDAMQMGIHVYQALKHLLKENGFSVNVGDEGGFAPQLSSTRQALDLLISAIEKAGYTAGKDFAISLDCASNEYFKDGHYVLRGEGLTLTPLQMIDYFETLVQNYPILSIEDPLHEDDWDHYHLLTQRLHQRVIIIGDDLFVTNKKRLEKGIQNQSATGILIKPNQIGTLTETMDVILHAQKKGLTTVMSHRSGETEDTTIAHLALAMRTPYIKMGAPCRTERVAKYNEIIRLTERT